METKDPSLKQDSLSKNAFYGDSSPWKLLSDPSMIGVLPPGKYSIEIMHGFGGGIDPGKYNHKQITFEVADKDINLGKIVLTKK